MRIYLAEAGQLWKASMPDPEYYRGVYLLQSYYYASSFTEKILIPHCKDFLLDSGAFTFMQTAKHGIDWDTYCRGYADFIVRNGIKRYFELDIDSVVGYEKVKMFREKLEASTGTRCIPVWHNSRGKDEFIRMCRDYDYVAIGGLVGGKAEYSQKYWRYFPWFIDTAHEHGAKIHALGFTSVKGLSQYAFDSVDSTAWTSGNRFGGDVYRFDGKTIITMHKPKGKRIKDHNALARHNFAEWVKYQRYADVYM